VVFVFEATRILLLEFDTNPVKNSATNARSLDNPEQTFAKTRKRGATAS
jgi:hypothetical protein